MTVTVLDFGRTGWWRKECRLLFCVGVTVALDPRTAPISGETMKYSALVALQFSVTLVPADTEAALR